MKIKLLSFPYVKERIVVDNNPLEVFVDEGVFVVDKVLQLNEGRRVEEGTILMRDRLETQSCRKSAKRTGKREVKTQRVQEEERSRGGGDRD